MEEKSVRDPQQEPDVQADQHRQRNIADGFRAKRMQCLGKIGESAKSTGSKANDSNVIHDDWIPLRQMCFVNLRTMRKFRRSSRLRLLDRKHDLAVIGALEQQAMRLRGLLHRQRVA